LIGFDDSVVAEEIADTVATAGGCKAHEVRVSTTRPMANGLYSAWIECPLAAAIKAAQPGKIKIGWTVARIELLRQRPVQCYRCWGRGHLRAQCRSEVDRTKACYRCGREDHQVAGCTNPVHCALCVSKGRNADHRVGSTACKADPNRNVSQSREEERVVDMEVDETERGSVIRDLDNA